MKTVFLLLYILFSLAHLWFSWRDERKARAMTKPFLLIFLLLYYLKASAAPELFLALALFTSWLGDVLLIPKGNKWFALGGVSFMLSHLFFVLSYLRRIEPGRVLWLAVLLAALVYGAISLRIILSLRARTPKKMLFPMCFYLLANSAMNIFALMQLFSLGSVGAWIAYGGAVLFFVSDCTLFLVRYHEKEDLIFKRHFTVMLTYLLGEYLITAGMILMGG